MKIIGVNQTQKDLLDKLWEFETKEEMEAWCISEMRKKLNDYLEFKRDLAVLIKLIKLGAIDDYVDQMTNFPDADKILKQIA